MKPLITGTTNIIAIDSSKKELFVQKYNNAVSDFKKDSVVQELQPVLQQESESMAPKIEESILNDSLTNADILSQSFGATDLKPVPEVNHPEFSASTATNSGLTEIVYDIAKIQDNLDKIIAKILTITPDKNIENKENLENLAPLNIPVREEEVIIPQNMNAGLIEDGPEQEITPFVPGSSNIFDEPQGPNMAA